MYHIYAEILTQTQLASPKRQQNNNRSPAGVSNNHNSHSSELSKVLGGSDSLSVARSCFVTPSCNMYVIRLVRSNGRKKIVAMGYVAWLFVGP